MRKIQAHHVKANKKFKQKMSASRLLVEALILIAWAPMYCLCFIHAAPGYFGTECGLISAETYFPIPSLFNCP